MPAHGLGFWGVQALGLRAQPRGFEVLVEGFARRGLAVGKVFATAQGSLQGIRDQNAAVIAEV